MELKKHLLILSLLLLALSSGCASTPDVVEKVVYVPLEVPVKERPQPVELYGVDWYVVTEDNVDQFLRQYQDKTGDVVFIALSVPHYENMSLNLAELKRYIEQQQAIIVYYETRVTEDIINKED